MISAPFAPNNINRTSKYQASCGYLFFLWPAFVPVDDPSRKAYIGFQNMGSVFTRRFEADHISCQVPIKLMHLEGLYELFVSKFAYAAVDLSMHHFKVHFKMKLTYRTPTYDDEDELQEAGADITRSGEVFESNPNGKREWDDDCPWSEWYLAEDPVKGFTLVAVWPDITAESSLDMAELENASTLEADNWFLYPNISQNFAITNGNAIGFASQLHHLVVALEMSIEAEFIEDFVSVEKYDSENLNPPAVIPPPIVLDRVLKDLFHEVQTDFSLPERKSSQAIKGAPLVSLFAQFCLHALWFGNCNIRAIAVLWIEFVREVRWCWEESQPLPRMPPNGTINLSTCLVNQKLHMLAICIYKKRLQGKGSNIGRHDDSAIAHVQENLQIPGEFFASHGVEDFDRKNDRKGSSGIAKPMMLLKSRKIMYAPITQDPPPMTEDMHEERLQAAEALGDSFISGQLEKDILASDMSAFKAANPDAVFEDFIRWHSPKDWETKDGKEIEESQINSGETSEAVWPPHGRLSERMSDHGNSWRRIWNEALPLHASEQKPLVDPIREGEKALHYLETLRPQQLLEQMVCTAFSATADTLNLTSFGGLEQMTTKMGQLYITLASILKYMQSAYNTTCGSDVIKDLRELCVTFEHVEQLTLLAASLHRKFLQSPHLAEAIFNDYCDYYLPEMGKGYVQGDAKKEFNKKQQIQSRDRNAIAGMFTPPTARQSWRKALRMGNLLNGHEPILRELIFSKHGRARGSYCASGTHMFCQQEIETHRMYVRGTSDDLSVALSVASCD